MIIIKLDAIDSTNDFLKRLSAVETTKNWTVVVAQSQTAGKGQMGAQWQSESGKNLTMSILVKDTSVKATEIFDVNLAVAVSIIEILQNLEIADLAIKWPNDIMSDNKKIGGILIENQFKADKQVVSIIGIGLNVNQTNFENLPKASSIANVTNKSFDTDLLMELIVLKIQQNFDFIINKNVDHLWQKFNQNLFKRGSVISYIDKNKKQFDAIIQEVNREGKLILRHTIDDSINSYGLKEIEMIY
jgi:BirA family biotin operon repressor/biotin-[acetyl-CoA-carboxylase] ligase